MLDFPHTVHATGKERKGGVETPWPGSVEILAKEGT